MRPFLVSLVLIIFPLFLSAQTKSEGVNIPSSIFVQYPAGHIQGFAVDLQKGYVYVSFTTVFLKTDLSGNILATIEGIPGHLGAMAFNPKDRKVYASLEFKDDSIGKGVAQLTGTAQLSADEVAFYIAIIDVDKMDRIGLKGENSDIFRTVCILDACRDYSAQVNVNGKTIKHRYGCSGIDGVAIAPELGTENERLDLYVAYGIYSDLDRTDNDNQVILRYDISQWGKYSRTISYSQKHYSGPKKASSKYFVYTGNTNWGVQNMTYDASQHRLYLAVYKGSKPMFPNYDLFSIDVDQKPQKAYPKGVTDARHSIVKLADGGLSEDGINGWRFRWGSTGMQALGNGVWYLSENGKKDGIQNSTIRSYIWTGDKDVPFSITSR